VFAINTRYSHESILHSFACFDLLYFSQEEWAKRWKVFPSRLFTAFAKYHVVILVIRLYEHIAAKKYDKVILDKLTMDSFHAARKLVAQTTPEHRDNTEIARQMFYTTFWSNLIGFLADYSVHQVILCYGYYRYVQKRRRRRRLNTKDNQNDEKEGMDGAIFTSLVKKSTQLMVSRSFGLVCSSVGGGVGTVLWPGWGTLLVSNMGEGAAGVILDDGQKAAASKK
jgi:hypothetical protein